MTFFILLNKIKRRLSDFQYDYALPQNSKKNADFFYKIVKNFGFSLMPFSADQ